MTILFQGDSITDAFRKPEERNNAYQLGAGFVLMIAGRLLRDYPHYDLRILNRGVSGNRVTDLLPRWQTDCLDLRPNFLSLLIGVNDTLAGTAHDRFSEDYAALLERTRRSLPGIRIALGEPFLLPCGAITEKQQNDIAGRRASVRRLAQESDAIVIPFHSAFERALSSAPAAYWAYDGIHPTAPGFQLMAETWLATVVKSHGSGT